MSNPAETVPTDAYGIFAGPSTPPFTNSFWTIPGVASAPVHTNSAAIVAELVGDLAAFGGTAAFNAHEFNTSVVYAPAGTPRYTVGFFNAQSKPLPQDSFAAVCASVPIPAGALPSTGSDGELTIIDLSTSPATVYEFWRWAYYATPTMEALPNTNPVRYLQRPAGYSATWGGMTTLDGPGYFTNGLGASSSECVILGGAIGIREAQASFANGHAALSHALNMAVPTIGPASRVQWPAQNSDGSSSSSLLNYGQMFRLPASTVLTGRGMTNIGYMIARTLMAFPLVLTDQGGAVSIIAESPNAVVGQGLADPWAALKSPLTAAQDYIVMQGFPWDQLVAIAPNWGEYPGSPTWTNSQLNVYQGSTIVATASSPGTAASLVGNLNGGIPGTSYVVSGSTGIQRTSSGVVIANGTTASNATMIVGLLNALYNGTPNVTPTPSPAPASNALVSAVDSASPVILPAAGGSYDVTFASANALGLGPQSSPIRVTVTGAPPVTSSVAPLVIPAVNGSGARLVTAGSTARLKLAGVAVWGIPDGSSGNSNPDFSAVQHTNRAAICARIKAIGGKTLRIRVYADEYVKQTKSSSATQIQWIKDWRDACKAAGIYIQICWWDALEEHNSWAPSYTFPMMRDVYAALKVNGADDPWVYYEPWNEPNGADYSGSDTNWTKWLTNMKATVDLWRTSLGYQGFMIYDTPNWSGKYSDGPMSALENYDASKMISGKHNIAFAYHNYSGSTSQGWSTPNWLSATGGSSTAHVIVETEFGNYNGSGTTSTSWAAGCTAYFRDNLFARTNIGGAQAFLWGNWYDGNAISSDAIGNNLTTWGNDVANWLSGSGGG